MTCDLIVNRIIADIKQIIRISSLFSFLEDSSRPFPDDRKIRMMFYAREIKTELKGMSSVKTELIPCRFWFLHQVILQASSGYPPLRSLALSLTPVQGRGSISFLCS